MLKESSIIRNRYNMESLLKDKAWLSEKIDRISNVLNRINELLSIVCIALLAFLGIGGFKSSNGWSILFLFAIPAMVFNIFVWKLIRYVCVAVALFLSDSCNKHCNIESE